ncbi:hypothetical protein HYDPIDRAFT_33809 [Hydnomerulius pinastri MD-312]|uniref:Anoctamin transmembrane domain-containing protein n=1 Tax=Hydnomerulius pinastri MD-312 TaxID=994086 RepID=A0A0C9W7G2_9AGAM|nr:hypothetical protein HYDPIDRAFT_33809 [Hydnomerulius pinastri MD-312]
MESCESSQNAKHGTSFNPSWDQFGDSVVLHFFFLTAYTRALIFLADFGVMFYFFGTPDTALYSSLLLSVRWCTRGLFLVEKRRADYIPSFPWWTRRMASVPMILLFASALVVMLTGICVLKAFVTRLYKGPGHRIVAFSPTLLFMALVQKLLEIYKTHTTRFTNWENHAHQSSHASTRVFTLSTMNAYLGLALSAFVYFPFGGSVMHFVHYPMFFSGAHHAAAILERLNINLNETVNFVSGGGRREKAVEKVTTHNLFEADRANARRKLNPSRLQEQIFASTVTDQVKRKRERRKKKRFAFDHEPTGQGQDARTKEECEVLDTVRSEVSLPEYEVFEDYGEMVTQFGYVALWSTIWPLAPVMALLNNYIEARSDAFKTGVHT